jgi:hypothetical protein
VRSAGDTKTDITEGSEMANEVSDEIVVQIRAHQIGASCMRPRRLVSDGSSERERERERTLTATTESDARVEVTVHARGDAVVVGDGVEIHVL